MKINSAKVLSILAILMLAFSPVFASQNVISSIVISKSKEKPNHYELNIDSSQSVQYKTNYEQDGSVYFDLKNSVLAQNALPVYDDVADIENLSVKQLEKNKVRIYIKGKNARNTDVIFINSLFEPKEQKKIVINRPVSEYKSTSFDEDLEGQGDLQDWDDNSFNFSHLLLSIITSVKEGVGSMMVLILSLLAVFVLLFKKIASKITQDQEPLIGMSSKKLAQNGITTKELIEKSELSNVSTRSRALESAQAELSKAHQKYQAYIQNKYQGKPKQSSVNTDAIKRSIALNQYQKNNKNPYLDQEVLRINKEFPTNVIKTQGSQRQFQKQSTETNAIEKNIAFKSPYIQRKENQIEEGTSEKIYHKPDNMKFLESVTKIYEQSGRKDLASGLKNSITRAKQTF